MSIYDLYATSVPRIKTMASLHVATLTVKRELLTLRSYLCTNGSSQWYPCKYEMLPSFHILKYERISYIISVKLRSESEGRESKGREREANINNYGFIWLLGG